MHSLRRSRLQAKFKAQAWNIGEDATPSKFSSGDAGWFMMLNKGFRALLPKEGANARLEKAKKLLKLGTMGVE